MSIPRTGSIKGLSALKNGCEPVAIALVLVTVELQDLIILWDLMY